MEQAASLLDNELELNECKYLHFALNNLKIGFGRLLGVEHYLCLKRAGFNSQVTRVSEIKWSVCVFRHPFFVNHLFSQDSSVVPTPNEQPKELNYQSFPESGLYSISCASVKCLLNEHPHCLFWSS